MPALIFLVIATTGGNLFGFLSQLAYNSGILSKFAEFAKASVLSPLQMFLWAVVGIILTMLSLLSAFFLMSKFQQWQNKG